jgi:DMSO/TMAO reductase YedYZ molybdopterin-dependent catalytic subunit
MRRIVSPGGRFAIVRARFGRIPRTVISVKPGLRRIAGAVAVFVALGVSELAAGLVAAVPSLVGGVADLVIDTVPKPVRDLAIDVFGVYDKLALGIGIVVVASALGAWVGGRSRGRDTLGWVVFGAFGLAAALAAARSPQADAGGALVAGALAALAGTESLRFLVDRRRGAVPADRDRRAFLGLAGGMAALAVLAAAGGRALLDRARVLAASRDEVVLPPAAEPAAAPSADASLAVAGISPVVTSNETFYRIDTAAFSVPRVDLESWRLRITGMVDAERSFSFEDLLDMRSVERYVTLSCVSNEVGGRLVGNALWLGIPLGTLLDRAGVAPGAEQVVGRSVDGFTVGFPVEAVYDGRDALVAFGMNGEPLPFEHGFPARLVVAGLYGYVSATKWLSEIELTTWDGFDAYWIPRGWAKEAPIKTQSRIDVPRGRARLEAGTQAIAGVAWAPDRGISKVEVQVDDGPWMEAELAAAIDEDTWRQWRYTWDASPGNHTLRVRATDGTGTTQPAEIRPPAPDGATGYHTITVEVV